MGRVRSSSVLGWAVALLVSIAGSAAARDNFLIIILDDVGVDLINLYSRDDLYGHDGEGASPGDTDNIDQLASVGVLFRNAWTNPVCAPTRAQMLTGRHGFRTGIGTPNAAFLELSETTLAELMRPTHATSALGKWHLADGDADHPNNQGFDYYAGGLGGRIRDYSSWDKTTNGVTVSNHTVYGTTDNVDEAIARIAAAGEDPWFVWLAFNSAHAPVHVPPASLQSTGITDSAGRDEKVRAMVEAADTEIGRLLGSIPQGVLDDTTIFLIGDNGTTRRGTVSPFIPDRAKGTVYEGGLNVPFIVTSPRIDPADEGSESLVLVHTLDVFATVLEIAGVYGYAEDSLSLVPYLENPAAPTQAIRPFVYAERFQPNGFGPYTEEQRAIRGETYKLIWRDGAYVELYDLIADRWEQDNLLPIGDLTPDELTAYNALVVAMENRADPLPPPDPGEAPNFIPALPIWGAALLGLGLIAGGRSLLRRTP